jgi:hypothetical protein
MKNKDKDLGNCDFAGTITLEFDALFPSSTHGPFEISSSEMVYKLCSMVTGTPERLRPLMCKGRALCNLRSLQEEGLTSGDTVYARYATGSIGARHEWCFTRFIAARGFSGPKHKWNSPYPEDPLCQCGVCVDGYRFSYLAQPDDCLPTLPMDAVVMLAHEMPRHGSNGVSTGYTMVMPSITTDNVRFLQYPRPEDVTERLPSSLPEMIRGLVSSYIICRHESCNFTCRESLRELVQVRGCRTKYVRFGDMDTITLTHSAALRAGARYLLSINHPKPGALHIKAAGMGDWIGPILIPFVVSGCSSASYVTPSSGSSKNKRKKLK